MQNNCDEYMLVSMYNTMFIHELLNVHWAKCVTWASLNNLGQAAIHYLLGWL